MTEQTMAREFSAELISRDFPVVDTGLLKDTQYQLWIANQMANQFVDWRLPVEGLVERPLSLSLEDIKSLPAKTQITLHNCQEGWSAIGQWTGTKLSEVLSLAGLKPAARYVTFECVDGWYDYLDLFDALHAQTILAYGMNGKELPTQHGAPVRLRVERQLGYKSLKYLKRISVVDQPARIVEYTNSNTARLFEYAWYAGI